MKKKLIGVFLLMSLVCGSISAQGLPDRKETLETLIKVNNYFMKKYADYRTPSYNGIIRPSNIWTRGVYYEGLMALHSVFPREEYYDYAYQWADYHKWGMRNGNTTRNADDQCCGQVYIELYNICPDPEMIKNIIITVTYNAEAVLEDTIQSVISQTYHHVEYIIIDGASKDRTLAIAERYRDRITPAC